MASRFSRKQNTQEPRKVIRIYTEGAKTEPNYFNSIKDELRLNEIDIKVDGRGDHTVSLVEWVIERKNELSSTDEDTEWWVVFDKDDHSGFTHNKYKSIFLAPDISVAQKYGDNVLAVMANVKGNESESLTKIKDLILRDSHIAKEHRDEFEKLSFEEIEEFLMPSSDTSRDPNDTGKSLEDYLAEIGVTGRQLENKVVEIFIPSEIHILGSETDVENYKEFIEKTSRNPRTLSSRM